MIEIIPIENINLKSSETINYENSNISIIGIRTISKIMDVDKYPIKIKDLLSKIF